MNLDDLFSLKGKIALVTGAAQGLGREIALGLVHYGAALVLADVRYPKETEKLIKEKGGRCIAVQTDITDEEQVINLTETATAKYGQVDILINNAGISQMGYTATKDLPVDEWDHILNTNLRGTFLCCKNIGKLMMNAGGGSIVNIASTAGIIGISRAPAYCASKSGIILLAKSLALEWARYDIRVNSIAPHYLETDLTQGLRDSKKIHNSIVKQIPMGRLGKPSEVIGAVLYLASDASTFTTGAVITIDGGYLSQ